MIPLSADKVRVTPIGNGGSQRNVRKLICHRSNDGASGEHQSWAMEAVTRAQEVQTGSPNRKSKLVVVLSRVQFSCAAIAFIRSRISLVLFIDRLKRCLLFLYIASSCYDLWVDLELRTKYLTPLVHTS